MDETTVRQTEKEKKERKKQNETKNDKMQWLSKKNDVYSHTFLVKR